MARVRFLSDFSKKFGLLSESQQLLKRYLFYLFTDNLSIWLIIFIVTMELEFRRLHSLVAISIAFQFNIVCHTYMICLSHPSCKFYQPIYQALQRKVCSIEDCPT